MMAGDYKPFYQNQHDTLIPSKSTEKINSQKVSLQSSPAFTNMGNGGNLEDLRTMAMFQQRDPRLVTEEQQEFESSEDMKYHHAARSGRSPPVLNKNFNNRFVVQHDNTTNNNKYLQRGTPSILLSTKQDNSMQSSLETTQRSVSFGSPREVITEERFMTNQERSTPIRTTDDGDGQNNFTIGTLVEARLDDGNYYPGKIIRIHFDGSCDLLLDSGERKLGISKERVRSQRKRGYIVDDQGGTNQNKNTTTKGTLQSNQVADNRTDDTLKIGSTVEVKRRSDGKLVSGKIMRKRRDGTFDVLCHDGDKEYGEFGVAVESIRSMKTSVVSSQKSIVIPSSPKIQDRPDWTVSNNSSAHKIRMTASTEVELNVGMAIEARYKGKNKYFPGKITRKRFDGTFDVLYSNGGREIGVPAELIRSPVDEDIEAIGTTHGGDNENSVFEKAQMETEKVGTTRLKNFEPRLGDTVGVKLKGKDNYQSGSTRQRFGGSYDILLDDGQLDLGVGRDMIISKKDDQTIEISPFKSDTVMHVEDTNDIEMGADIDAKVRDKDKYYPDEIIRNRFDGYSNNVHSDQLQEIGVTGDDLIERVQEGQGVFNIHRETRPANNNNFGEMKLRSEKKDLNHEDTDENYHNDGNQRTSAFHDNRGNGRVCNNFIGPPKKTTSASTKHFHSNDERALDTRALCVGDEVESRFRGAINSRYYPGRIAGIHPDGTCDVDYDDGDKDRHLDAEHIRLLVPRQGHVETAMGPVANEDDAAKMIDVVSSSDINNGDKNMTKRMMRDNPADDVEKYSNDRSSSRLSVGDKVESRFRGAINSRYYPGHIARIHPNGTYDVDYDDGDKDRHLGAEHIRLLVSNRYNDERLKMNNTRRSGYFNVSDIHHQEKNRGVEANTNENYNEESIIQVKLINQLESKLRNIERELSNVNIILSEMKGGMRSR
eukprot:CAMPEP_0176492826 /NCGR_PEP_ID=MMETSP0200_2-20121128/9218_1 /TAXON_ID=947934 /ORGANISM="Chaetoceros sp., Strain GSL56" /LENGTH=936 /DNA_ID=CAMNT_0017890439 /DNA_START=616 /DNA_END=3426 /DNA_ORIENTATION=+